MANDPFSGLAEGLKWGLERGDKARESQAEMAFRLKMQNAMLEQQLANQMKLKSQENQFQTDEFNREDTVNPQFGSDLGKLAGMQAPKTVKEAEIMAGLINAKERATNGGRGAGRDSISGAFANKMLKANVFNPKSSVTRLAYSAAQKRIADETPSAALDTAYLELQAGRKNMLELVKLRKKADASGWTGPIGGRAGVALGSLTGGKAAAKTLDLEATSELYAPGVAKAVGHVGNLNITETAAALKGIGNASLSGDVAIPRIERLIGHFDRKIAEIEKQKPAVKRRKETSAAGDDLLTNDPFSVSQEEEASILNSDNSADTPKPVKYDGVETDELMNLLISRRAARAKAKQKGQ